MNHKQLDKYLLEIQNRDILLKEFDIFPLQWTAYLFLIFQLIAEVGVVYLMSKTNADLSKTLSEFLKEDWKVYVMNTNIVNALSFGAGFKTVFITKGAIKQLTEREVMAVLLHEANHSRKFDSVVQMIASLGLTEGLRKLLMYVSNLGSSKLTLSLTCACLIVMFFGRTAIVNITFGKYHEIKADQYAASLGYGPELISALTKIEKIYKKNNRGCSNKFCKTVDSLERFFDAHPSLETRTRKILEKMDEVKGKSVSQIKSWIHDIVTSEEE